MTEIGQMIWNEGREEGRKEGREEVRESFVTNLIISGFDNDFIAMQANCTNEYVASLRKHLMKKISR